MIICWYIMPPMDQPKRTRGRPPVEDGEKLYLTIRVSEERKAKYERAAQKAKATLSAWIKGVLDRASRR
jgi:predicted HicB family RNase H-like nuclease